MAAYPQQLLQKAFLDIREKHDLRVSDPYHCRGCTGCLSFPNGQRQPHECRLLWLCWLHPRQCGPHAIPQTPLPVVKSFFVDPVRLAVFPFLHSAFSTVLHDPQPLLHPVLLRMLIHFSTPLAKCFSPFLLFLYFPLAAWGSVPFFILRFSTAGYLTLTNLDCRVRFLWRLLLFRLWRAGIRRFWLVKVCLPAEPRFNWDC